MLGEGGSAASDLRAHCLCRRAGLQRLETDIERLAEAFVASTDGEVKAAETFSTHPHGCGSLVSLGKAISDLRRHFKEAQALQSKVAQLRNDAESLTASGAACFANSTQQALIAFKPAGSDQEFACVTKTRAPGTLLMCPALAKTVVEAFVGQDNVGPPWAIGLLSASQSGALLRESDAGSDIGSVASVCKDGGDFGTRSDFSSLLSITTGVTKDAKANSELLKEDAQPTGSGRRAARLGMTERRRR